MRAHRCCPQTPAEAQAAEAPTRVDQESQTVAPFKASWYEYRPQILLTTHKSYRPAPPPAARDRSETSFGGNGNGNR